MKKRDRNNLDGLLAMLTMMNFDLACRTDGDGIWVLTFTKVGK